MTIDSLGNKMPATIRIQLRADSGSGVALGFGRNLEPGEVADVPFAIGVRLLSSGRATRVESLDELHTSAAADTAGERR